MSWTLYTYSDPQLLPVARDADGGLAEGDWPSDAEIVAAGFCPGDDELGCGVLAEDWYGHRSGSRVLTGLTVAGYTFAIEIWFVPCTRRARTGFAVTVVDAHPHTLWRCRGER